MYAMLVGSKEHMKHVVFYSGGASSWCTAQRVIERHGADNVTLYFTDTLIECADLYRFLIEGAAHLFGVTGLEDVVRAAAELPETTDEEAIEVRKAVLPGLAAATMAAIPQFVWFIDGRTPWDVFYDVRMMGSTRADPCSRVLKREPSHKWIESNYTPDEVVLHIGMDWTEMHRLEGTRRAWAPYQVEAYMAEKPLLLKDQMLSLVRDAGIAVPRLYGLGHSHNNCSGWCVKAGHAQFRHLLETSPDVFDWHARNEVEFAEFIGSEVAIMRDRTGGSTSPFQMHRLRGERGTEQQERLDWGGCGCFIG